MLASLLSCQREAPVPVYSDDEIPYIYTEFNNYISTIAGQQVELTLYVLPSDGSVSCSWTLEGEEIGKEPSIVFTAPKTAGNMCSSLRPSGKSRPTPAPSPWR